MAEFETKELKQLIAQRVPPGDRWSLIASDSFETEGKIYESLTDTLEVYFQKTRFNAAFYLDPLGGALYAVERQEIEIEPEPIKTFDFYGDGYQ